MRRFVLVCGCLLGLARLASAEIITVNYTEPVASGTLAYTSVYVCQGAACTDFALVMDPRKGVIPSTTANGGVVRAVPVNIRLTQGTLPLTFRLKVTTTDISNNETSGVIVNWTFN